MRIVNVLLGTAAAVAALGTGVLATTPVTTTIEPSSGYVDGDTPVTLTGHDFEPGICFALVAGGGHEAQRLSTSGVVSIAVAGRHAFAATYTSLLTLDLFTPGSPQLVGMLPLGGWPGHLRAADERVFVALSDAGTSRLRIFSVEDAVLPVLLGEVPFDAPSTQFGYANGFLHLPRARRGFDVVDVRDAAHPVTVAQYREPGFRVEAIEVIGPIAYVAGMQSSTQGANYPIVQILDVSSPAAPRLLAAGDLPGTVGRFAPTTQGVLLSTSQGLVAINYDGTFLAHLKTVRQAGSDPSFIVTSGTCAAYFHGVIEMLDITDPFAPQTRGRFPVAQNFARGGNPLAFLEGFAYWGLDSGLAVFDACEPYAAAPLHERAHRFGLKDIAFTDDRVHFLDQLGQLHVTALLDPTAPVGIGTTQDLALGDCVAVSGDLAFVGGRTWSWYDRGVLSVVDESVSGVMPVIGSVSLVGPPAAIDAAFDQVYVGGWSALWGGSLELVDISNPREPRVASRLEGLARPWTIVAGNGAVYYFTDWMLTIVDTSDPAAPAVSATQGGFGWPTDGVLAGNLLFVTEMVPWSYDLGRLKVLDVSSPLTPVLVAELPITGLPLGVDADDSRVVVTTDSEGVFVYDLDRGLPPRLIQSLADYGDHVGLFDGFASVHRAGSWTTYQLNPPNEGTCPTSGECAQSIVPTGVARGLYDVATVCPHGHASRLRDAYRSCERHQLTSRLVPLVEQGLPLRWQLALEGDDFFFDPPVSHTARLVLPELPDALQTLYLPANQPNYSRIVIELPPSLESGTVRLVGDDRAMLDALWEKIRSTGAIELVRVDNQHYGDFSLSTAKQGERFGSLAAFRYEFSFYGARLDSASASGPGADFVFEANGTDDIRCSTDAPTTYSDGLQEACEEWGATYPGLIPGCLW